MHIIIAESGFYFSGKVSELRLILGRLAGVRLPFAAFLRQNLQ
jgi:hypothetical protein